LGARAIDVHEQGGSVKGLLDVDIHGAGMWRISLASFSPTA